jgi:hypothetical protein
MGLNVNVQFTTPSGSFFVIQNAFHLMFALFESDQLSDVHNAFPQRLRRLAFEFLMKLNLKDASIGLIVAIDKEAKI